MSVLTKGVDFTTGDQVTAANLDNLVDNATFAAGAVDDSTTQISGEAIIVKDGGITSAKMDTNIAVAGSLTAGTSLIADTGTGTRLSSPVASQVILGGADNGFNAVHGDTYSNSGYAGLYLLGRSMGGTRATPAATPSGATLIQMIGYGFGSAVNTTASAFYKILANSLWSGSNRETAHQWWGTPSGSTTNAQWMSLSGSGLSLATPLAVASGGTGTASPAITAGTNIDSITGTWPNVTINAATQGGGSVTAIGVTTANGVSGTSSGGATPNLTIALGAITPSSVTVSGLTATRFLMTDGSKVLTSKTAAEIWAAQTVAANSISALEIDWAVGPNHYKTLGANSTFTFANATDGQTIIVALTNTASNYTVTWPTVRWAGGAQPTQTIGAKTDVYTFTKMGSNIYGTAVQNMS